MTRYLGGLITKDESLVLPANNFQDTSAPGVWTLEEAQALNKQGLWPTAGVSNPQKFIENIFSIDIWSGTSSDQSINNGIDLQNNDGLVWIKNRSQDNVHILFDSKRGSNPFEKRLNSNATDGEFFDQFGHYIVPNSNGNGFTTKGNDAAINSDSSYDYVSWAFRKAPKFFDVVTYTGDGSAGKTISHSLGQAPGMILVKNIDQTDNWAVYHRGADSSAPEDKYLILNTNAAVADSADWWNDTAPTSSVFTVGTDHSVNANGENYVAYLFGHDTSSDGMIQCGSYTGNSSNPGPSVTLGFEPQWLLVKDTTNTNDWFIWDTIRGLPANVANSSRSLNPNKTDAEATEYGTAPTATGFQLQDNNAAINNNGATYIYVAIRRGPMATPTSRASVFDVELGNTSLNDNDLTMNTGFPVDLAMFRDNYASGGSNYMRDRLRGNKVLSTELDNAESGGSTTTSFDTAKGLINRAGDGYGNYSGNLYNAWRRAPGFFDIVAYTGTGSARTLNHNLGVAPEMIWCKSRETVSSSNSWWVYHKNLPTPNDDGFTVNSLGNINLNSGTLLWNSTAPTSTVFSLGTYNGLNQSGKDYIAYLWATLAGISKVGSFSHTNGSSTDVDCGFSSGSSLVMVRRIDSGISNNALFYHWDNVRGIVSGNDSYLSLNNNASAVTNTDLIDPLNSGFQIASGFTTGDYIFYAIAA